MLNDTDGDIILTDSTVFVHLVKCFHLGHDLELGHLISWDFAHLRCNDDWRENFHLLLVALLNILQSIFLGQGLFSRGDHLDALDKLYLLQGSRDLEFLGGILSVCPFSFLVDLLVDLDISHYSERHAIICALHLSLKRHHLLGKLLLPRSIL